MKFRGIYTAGLAAFTAGTIAASTGCVAQAEKYPTRPNIELDFDLRSRIAAGGKTRSGLYAGTLHLDTELARGWRFSFRGDRKSRELMGGGSSNFQVQQVFVEREQSGQRLRAGIVQIPFGIYDTRETYASGIIDYPMARGDYGYNSVDWGAPGISWLGGSPNLQVEAAAVNGRGAGIWGNSNHVDGGAVRLQTYVGRLILGVSRWNGHIDFTVPESGSGYGGGLFTVNQRRDVRINGVDVRFTLPHLLLRGEYIFGTLADNQTHGGYLDVYYHLPKFEKWTLAGRLEALRPGTNLPYAKQITLGVRYTASPDWVLAVDWLRNNAKSIYKYSWTPYSGRGGNFLLQAYHKLKL